MTRGPILSAAMLSLSLHAAAALAAEPACSVQAADKKLAGAAKASFVKKCVSDAS